MIPLSRALDKKPSIVLITLIILLPLIAGVSVPFFPEETFLFSLLCIIIVFALVSNKFYDLMLLGCWLVFLFAQLHEILEIARWPIFLILVLLSAYLAQKQKLLINPVVLGLSLIALYSMMTSLASYYPSVSLLKSITLLILAGLILFLPLVIERLYPHIGIKEYILRIFLYLAIAVVISNTIYYLLRPFSTVGFHSSGSLLGGRFRGWFVTPNGIGAIYGIFFLPILAFALRKYKMGYAKLGLFFVFILAAIQLVASQSRAGIMAGIASLLVLILGPRKWGSRILLVSLIVLMALVIYIPSPGDNLIQRFIYRNEIELQGSGRLPIWIATWERFLARPLFGSGLGVSETDSVMDSIAFTTGGYSIEKGNSYLAALEELGLVGVLLIVAILLAPILKACWKGFNNNNLSRSSNSSNLVIIAIVIAGLFNATFEAWLLSAGGILGFSFWIFASLLFYKGEDLSKRLTS